MAITFNASTTSGLVVSSDTSGEIKFQDNGVDSLILPTSGTVTIPNGTGTVAVSSGVGTSGQVLTSNGSGTLPSFQTLVTVPSGAVIPYAGTTEPTGWLFCFGQAVSRTTYGALFTAISTTYGAGDGSTTFNLPDLRGRVVAGQDDMGGTSANRLTNQSGGLNGDTLGATGGSETHTLSTAELASHTHTYDKGSAAGSAAAGSTSYTTFSSVNTGSAGSGSAHNNVQPTIILNYIIKT